MARQTVDVPPHRHDPLPDEPADWQGWQVCSGRDGCGLLGAPGDPRHPAGAPALSVARQLAALDRVPADVRERDQAMRRWVETGDDDA